MLKALSTAVVAELLSLATALPPHAVTAEETKVELAAHMDDQVMVDRFQRMADQSRIRQRYVVIPAASATNLRTIEERQAAYFRHAIDLGEPAARSALVSAGIAPESVGAVLSVSCTGYMMPSLEVYLAHRIGLSPAARRVPITELGCSAGVAAIGLARELVGAAGARYALVISTELSSLCLQTSEPAVTDVIGALLFGDACAAAVIASDGGGRGLDLLGSRSLLWPETTSDLGMRLTTTGFRLDLSRHVPRLVRRHLRKTVEGFIAEYGASLSDIAFWAIHPGGPKVLDAIGESLRLSDAALCPSWDVWQRCGNVSSATALLILREVLDHHRPAPGSLGMLLAPGPGLSCEMVLMRAPTGTLAI